jgi:anaerobic C4-dicarboxylate transporter
MTLTNFLQFAVVLAAIWMGARCSTSQATTTRARTPLGMALDIPPQVLVAMFPSVNGYFLATAVAVITGLALAKVMF